MTMDMDKFTEKAQQAIGTAQEIALRMNHQQVDGEHLHMALLTQEDGLIPKLISYMGIDTGLLARDVQKELDKLPAVYGTSASGLYATRRLNQILLQAADEADRFKDEYAGVEHIYLALLKERGTPSTDIFRRNGSAGRISCQRSERSGAISGSHQRIRRKHMKHWPGWQGPGGHGAQGKLDPVIGRDSEIRRVIRILSRRTKTIPS